MCLCNRCRWSHRRLVDCLDVSPQPRHLRARVPACSHAQSARRHVWIRGLGSRKRPPHALGWRYCMPCVRPLSSASNHRIPSRFSSTQCLAINLECTKSNLRSSPDISGCSTSAPPRTARRRSLTSSTRTAATPCISSPSPASRRMPSSTAQRSSRTASCSLPASSALSWSAGPARSSAGSYASRCMCTVNARGRS